MILRIAHGIALAFALAGAALAAPPSLTPQPFVSGLAAPVEIAHANDSSGRLLVLEQAGRVRVIRNGQLLSTPFLNLTPANGGPVIANGEQGLLGIAFHPAYASNGRFFVYYTRARTGDPNGSDIVVARYQRSSANADVADPASASIVLVIPHPTHSNHNGGKLAFGPDGYLYVAVGDGGGGGDPFNAGQSLADLRGKILRIDVDAASPYAIPPTNPFANSTDPSVRKEIWAYGLRNPWKLSFDRLTGDVFIADVGQDAWEEVNFEPRATGGRNYGWRVFEGTHCFSPPSGCSLAGHVPPIIEYPHNASGGFSVTGGYRYRGGALPALAGYYVYGDYVSGRVWAAGPDAGPATWVPTQVASVSTLSAFGEDESGELYAASHGAGTIVRLTPPATTIPRLANISTRASVLQGEYVMIAGFVIGGTQPKRVVVNVAGPSLTGSGVQFPLANPKLTLVRSADSAVIAANNDWQAAANASEITASGFAPNHPAEPAILMTLAPGAYTAIVEDEGTVCANCGSVALVGVFEVDHPEVPLVNISTRGRVNTHENVLIAGFILQGDAPQTVVINVAGPSLADFGISEPLANPTLTLVRQSDGAVIAANDDWQSQSPSAVSAIQASGFRPNHPLEPALVATLAPGAYTAIVQGVGGTTGVGLVGVFKSP